MGNASDGTLSMKTYAAMYNIPNLEGTPSVSVLRTMLNNICLCMNNLGLGDPSSRLTIATFALIMAGSLMGGGVQSSAMQHDREYPK